MKILVTGANGQLGLSLRRLAPASGFDFVFTDVVELQGVETRMLDITDKKAVNDLVAGEDIRAIVNCAAYTNVDKAEEEEGLAFKLNAIAPSILANAMAAAGGLLIHISTDYVFDGTAVSPVEPGCPTGPRSAYGRTKLAGEKMIAGSGCNSVIIRTAWLYSEYGRNFVKTMLRLTAEKDAISVVSDQVGTPTYASDLAAAILKVLAAKFCSCEDRQADGENCATLGIITSRVSERKESSFSLPSVREEKRAALNGRYPSGWGPAQPDVFTSACLRSKKTGHEVYHYSNEGEISWYEFATEIARRAGTLRTGENPDGCLIRPCTTEEYPSKVDRPRYSVLSKDSFKAAYGVEVPFWTDSLALCLKSLL